MKSRVADKVFIALTASIEAERACTPFLDKAALREFEDIVFGLIQTSTNSFPNRVRSPLVPLNSAHKPTPAKQTKGKVSGSQSERCAGDHEYEAELV